MCAATSIGAEGARSGGTWMTRSIGRALGAIVAISALAACGPKPAAANTPAPLAPGAAPAAASAAPAAPSADANATDAAAQSILSFVSYDDPSENSFQISVPKG